MFWREWNKPKKNYTRLPSSPAASTQLDVPVGKLY